MQKLNYNQKINKTLAHSITKGLTFVVACVCVVVLGGMMTVGVLKLQPFSVVSNSMYPTLKVNELVFVKKVDAYSVGDIISFVSQDHGGIVITHRCIDKQNVGGKVHYYCAGDNTNLSAGVQDVVAEDIVGKVVYSSLFLGEIVNFVQLYRIPLIFGLLVLGFIIYLIDDYNKDIYYIEKTHI